MLRTDHEARVGKQQACWSAFLPRREQAASMVEMQMAENDHVDVFMSNAQAAQIVEQHMAFLAHAKTLAQSGLKKCADTGLEQHPLARQRSEEHTSELQ